MTREEIRQVLINHYGCRQADWSLGSQRDTVFDVSRLMTRVFKYTHDNELKTDKFLSIKRGRPDQWVSRHIEVATLKTPIEGDCDDYTMTGIQCSLILGVNPSRLAAVAVVDDKTIRGTVAVKPQINHLVGGFFTGQEWLACFDTWNMDRSQEYLPPIGQGRKLKDGHRHSGQLIAVASEGLNWRQFPEGWFKFTS